MKLLFKLFYHYLFGILYSSIAIMLVIFFDYLIKGYWLYPELNNFLKGLFFSSFGGALVHYSVVNFNKNNKNKNN